MHRRGNETGGCDGRRGKEDTLQKGHKEAGCPQPRNKRRARRPVVVGGTKAFLRLEVGSKMETCLLSSNEIWRKATNNGDLVAESRGQSPTARPRQTRPRPTSVRGRTRARRAIMATTAISLVNPKGDISATAEVTLAPPPWTWATA